MSVKRQIILIPYWIQDTLRRRGLPLATVLDFKALRQVLPLEDIATLVALQDYWGTVCGLREPCVGDVVLTWFKQVGFAGSEDNQQLSNTVIPLSKDASIRKDLQARLFEGSVRLEHREDPYITYDLTPEFAGAVISPGFFGGRSEHKLVLRFVQAMLKVLYVYEPHHEVAKAPLFRRYLSLLSA